MSNENRINVLVTTPEKQSCKVSARSSRRNQLGTSVKFLRRFWITYLSTIDTSCVNLQYSIMSEPQSEQPEFEKEIVEDEFAKDAYVLQTAQRRVAC